MWVSKLGQVYRETPNSATTKPAPSKHLHYSASDDVNELFQQAHHPRGSTEKPTPVETERMTSRPVMRHPFDEGTEIVRWRGKHHEFFVATFPGSVAAWKKKFRENEPLIWTDVLQRFEVYIGPLSERTRRASAQELNFEFDTENKEDAIKRILTEGTSDWYMTPSKKDNRGYESKGDGFRLEPVFEEKEHMHLQKSGKFNLP